MSRSSPWYAVCTWHRLSTNMTHQTVVATPPALASKVLMVTFKYSSSWCIFLRLIIDNVQVAASVFAIFGNLRTWLDSKFCCVILPQWYKCADVLIVYDCMAHNINDQTCCLKIHRVGPQSYSGGWAASRLGDLIICCCVMTMVTRTGWSKIHQANCRLLIIDKWYFQTKFWMMRTGWGFLPIPFWSHVKQTSCWPDT